MNAIVYHGSLASRQMIQQYEMYCKDDKVVIDSFSSVSSLQLGVLLIFTSSTKIAKTEEKKITVQ